MIMVGEAVGSFVGAAVVKVGEEVGSCVGYYNGEGNTSTKVEE